jgi:hypothetical protein
MKTFMELHDFGHTYHDAHPARFTLGPRREIVLEIALDPVWNKGRRTAHVRFSGIKNLDQVTAFLKRLPDPPASEAYLVEILELKLKSKHSRTATLKLVNLGHIEIEATHITEA